MTEREQQKITYSVEMIKVGEADVHGPEVWWMSHWDKWETLVFYVVVVRGGGRTLLINTGFDPDTTTQDEAWVAYNGDSRAAMRHGPNLLKSLSEMGVKPEDVTDIVLSPFQSYSTGNVLLFPSAQIHFSRRGWLDFHSLGGPLVDTMSIRDTSFPRHVLVHLVTDGWSRVHLLEDEDEVLPGISTFRAGVHHSESLGIIITTEKGPVLWTDGLFRFGNFELGHPVGLTLSLQESSDLQERVRAVGGLLVPAFDDTLLDRYPGGKIA